MTLELDITTVKTAFDNGRGVAVGAGSLNAEDLGKIAWIKTDAGEYLGKVDYIYHANSSTYVTLVALTNSKVEAKARLDHHHAVLIAKEDQL